MSEEPKFCKDCKHYSPRASGDHWHAASQGGYMVASETLRNLYRDRCAHPSQRDLVSGLADAEPKLMRLGGACGGDGLLWEAKPEPEIVATVVTGPPLVTQPETLGTIRAAEEYEPRPWWAIWL
jgi:hypothetical protein